MSDDDWFERALKEDDPDVSLPDDVTSLEADVSSDEETDEDESFSFGATDEESASSETSEETDEDDPFALGAVGSADSSSGGDESESQNESEGSMFEEEFGSELESAGQTAPSEPEEATDEDDPFALGAAESTGQSAGDDQFADNEQSGDDESMFEEDFASALGASGPADGTSSPPEQESGEDDPFALGAETVSDDSSGEGSLFDEDFASALEGVEVPGEGGGAGDISFGLGGSDDTDFDEELDTDLPRIDLGIDGLDRMIHGGVPERTLIAAIGEAGTGKTTFGLQFLDHGLAQGENAVFITLEETRERVINSATEKGYPFDEYEREGSLAVVDIDPVEMANSLSSIQNELPVLIEEFGASRLVLDSVSLLEMMYEDRAKRRNEIFDFARSLKQAGVTSMLTSEASERTPHASRYGIVEYLTDAVFVLQYIRPDDFRETRMAIEIQKIRDANHSREKKPYEITGEGISVYQQANLF